MPKDNETIRLPTEGSVTPSEPAGFAPEEMVRCEDCLRANPPTRFACLYCGAALALDESKVHLRRPILKQPEKHQLGFNCILVGNNTSSPDGARLTKAAELLKLKPELLDSILATKASIPLARTASREESQLVNDRLSELGFSIIVLSDEDLGRADVVVRVRALHFDDVSLSLSQPGGKVAIDLAWSDLKLVVSGRLLLQKVEVTERVSHQPENEILDTSEFFSDEPVLDIYSSTSDRTWRIGTNSFDFSCLEQEKSLIAAENLSKLKALIVSRCQTIREDARYADLRNILQVVWPSERESHSRGWRRERPGKYSLGAVTASSNESQFTRYSRLQRYFAINN